MHVKSMLKSRSAAVVGAAAVIALVGGGAGYAGGQIDSHDIKNNSVASKDIKDNTLKVKDLKNSTVKKLNGLDGAYYSVANYDIGNTNAGAIATVACKAETDVAISGGVQTLGLGDEGALNRNTPVSSSFPGRMDYSDNTPKPDRLDGWIIQFGGNAGEVSDAAPEYTKIWALCVPGADVPVEETYTQSADD